MRLGGHEWADKLTPTLVYCHFYKSLTGVLGYRIRSLDRTRSPLLDKNLMSDQLFLQTMNFLRTVLLVKVQQFGVRCIFELWAFYGYWWSRCRYISTFSFYLKFFDLWLNFNPWSKNATKQFGSISISKIIYTVI